MRLLAILARLVLTIGLMYSGASMLFAWLTTLIWNDSPSLPIGFYKQAHDGPIAGWCPAGPAAAQALQRNYRHAGICADGGQPLLKPIVARYGDRVELDPEGIWVNSVLLRNSAPMVKDSAGRPLEHYPYGHYAVEPGQVWVISSHDRRSFDSRYFGPVQEAAIQGHYKPLWVSQ